MTVYRTSGASPYRRYFRVLSWSAIAVLVAITLFALYEPQGVSRFTNVALAVLMGAIVLAAIVFGLFFSTKDALWKIRHDFQWEVTADKIIQSRSNGETIEIPLNGIKTLREFNSWLFVGGNESPKGIMISRDVDGYDENRTQLMARCPLTSAPRSNPVASILPFIAIATLFGFVIFSRVPAVVIGCGAAVLVLWPLFTGYAIRPFLRSKSPHRARIVISYFFSWLILAWVVFKSIKAVL